MNYLLTKEEINWIKLENEKLKDVEQYPNNYSDKDVKMNFIKFYHTVCSWYKRYPTPALEMFYLGGIGHVGIEVGNNADFINLYRNLMNMIKDGNVSKEVQYVRIHDNKSNLVSENSHGNITIIKKLK